MTRLLQTIMALWVGLAGMAHAENNPVVVELFTSQGCSSCPPADALLAALGARDDVIALALHVDYWDYIGWKDSFAIPGHTARQKGYAREGGRRSVYTPQMVINGQHDVVGSKPMKVADLVARHRAKPRPVALEVSREGGELRIEARAKGKVSKAQIYVVRFTPSQRVDIHRGENAGLKATYTNIALGWDDAGRWNGQGTFETRVPMPNDQPVVVLVQEPPYGPILAAARLR
ncbi:MAG: DUF1223 domain-containing protein [Paracoccaceae bacterium]|nr:DUF1223 domain-containing protein [Paracoccaceae bacterium]